MEVKSIRLNLQEASKIKANEWKLESEAFKDPLLLEIGYDDRDISYINASLDKVQKDREKSELILSKIENFENIYEQHVEALKKEIEVKDKLIEKLSNQLTNKSQREITLETDVKSLKTDNKMLHGVVLGLKEKINEIGKNAEKLPMVFKDRTFISGDEEVVLKILDVPDGSYTTILCIEIADCNEFVKNKDEVIIEQVYVEGGYMPKYKLYGGTELDKLTAKVNWALLLIPM